MNEQAIIHGLCQQLSRYTPEQVDDWEKLEELISLDIMPGLVRQLEEYWATLPPLADKREALFARSTLLARRYMPPLDDEYNNPLVFINRSPQQTAMICGECHRRMAREIEFLSVEKQRIWQYQLCQHCLSTLVTRLREEQFNKELHRAYEPLALTEVPTTLLRLVNCTAGHRLDGSSYATRRSSDQYRVGYDIITAVDFEQWPAWLPRQQLAGHTDSALLEAYGLIRQHLATQYAYNAQSSIIGGFSPAGIACHHADDNGLRRSCRAHQFIAQFSTEHVVASHYCPRAMLYLYEDSHEPGNLVAYIWN